ncbi:MAG: lysophospholipid acyltransferase family protein [Thermodesulfobacteriota bacterium]
MNRKLAHALYQPYKYLVYLPFLGASTAFFGSGAIVAMEFMDPRKVSDLFGKWWARVNAMATPMKVVVEGAENIKPGVSYVICSNHQSHFDIFVLYGYLPVDLRWVMKMELRKVPFLGAACEKIGHVYIDRSNREKALASLNEAKERIVNGTSIIFFPEGTRSEGGTLLPFKKGAFKMALDLSLPILPVTIDGTKNVLPARSLDLFPGTARLKIHPAVETSQYSDETMGELMDRVRDIIVSGLSD